jgi:hypothetical protein
MLFNLIVERKKIGNSRLFSSHRLIKSKRKNVTYQLNASSWNLAVDYRFVFLLTKRCFSLFFLLLLLLLLRCLSLVETLCPSILPFFACDSFFYFLFELKQSIVDACLYFAICWHNFASRNESEIYVVSTCLHHKQSLLLINHFSSTAIQVIHIYSLKQDELISTDDHWTGVVFHQILIDDDFQLWSMLCMHDCFSYAWHPIKSERKKSERLMK